MKNKCAILLVRVSTDSQDYNAQIEDLKKYAFDEGYNNIHIIETKESGLNDFEYRKGLQEVFKFIEQNKEYTTIITNELGRLGRRQFILLYVKEQLIQKKIQLIVKDLNFRLYDTDDRSSVSAWNDMTFTMLALFAESEINQKKLRFAREKRKLMKTGEGFWGGKVLFGYKLEPSLNGKNKLVIDEDNAKLVKQIFNYYVYGIDSENKNVSIVSISRHCVSRNYHKYTHSKRNVNKLLKEEAYTGFKVTNNKFRNHLYGKKENESEYKITNNEIKYPEIISRELFEKTQAKLKSNTSTKNNNKNITILANKIRCICGRHLTANYRNNSNSHSYRCSSRNQTIECNKASKSLSMQMMDSLIWNLIKDEKSVFEEAIKELNPNEKLLYLNNTKNHISDKISELNTQSETIKEEIQSIIKRSFRNINLSELRNGLYKELETIDNKISKLKSEKLSNENEIIKLNDEINSNSDFESIEIEKIENSKELLKKYINHFISEIQVKVSNSNYSIIHIKLNYPTVFLRNESKKYNNLILNDLKFMPLEEGTDLFGRDITILVNKKNTNKISYYKFYQNFNSSKYDVLNEIVEKYQIPINYIEKLKINQ